MVKNLLEFQVDVNVKNNNGDTALHLAVKNDHDSIVAILIREGEKLGIDLNESDNEKNSPLATALISKKVNVIQAFLYQNVFKEVHNITYNGKQKFFQHSLCQENSLATRKILKLLIEKPRNGLDLNLVNEEGETILMIALRMDFIEMANILLENDNIQMKSSEQSIIYPIIKKGHYYKVYQLLSLCSVDDWNKPITNGKFTALMVASINGFKNIVSLMVKEPDDKIQKEFKDYELRFPNYKVRITFFPGKIMVHEICKSVETFRGIDDLEITGRALVRILEESGPRELLDFLSMLYKSFANTLPPLFENYGHFSAIDLLANPDYYVQSMRFDQVACWARPPLQNKNILEGIRTAASGTPMGIADNILQSTMGNMNHWAFIARGKSEILTGVR